MICIRIFDTRKDAERAQKIIEEGGFYSEISEDKLWGIPIQRFGVCARFRLLIEDRDFYSVTDFIESKIKKKK